MDFIDTHVHFHFPDYESDREEVIAKARTSGVKRFINVGTDLQSSRDSLRLAESYSFIYASAGIHPHDAKDAAEGDFQALESILGHPRMVAVGEVGLDFFRNHSPREVQESVLKRFIEIHRWVKKPLILHCRDAYPELIALFKESGPPPYRGVIHCFSSDRETMECLVELGFYISFAGPLTYKKNDALREACKACPADRLLLETDSPFLPPQSRRGNRNEPACMLETAQAAARVREISLEDLSRQTTDNAHTLFGI